MSNERVIWDNATLKIILGDGNFDSQREHIYQWCRVARMDWVNSREGWLANFIEKYGYLKDSFNLFILFKNPEQALFLPDFYEANPEWIKAPKEWVIASLGGQLVERSKNFMV